MDPQKATFTETAGFLHAVATLVEQVAEHPAVIQGNAILDVLRRIEADVKLVNARLAKLEDRTGTLEAAVNSAKDGLVEITRDVRADLKGLADGVLDVKQGVGAIQLDVSSLTGEIANVRHEVMMTSADIGFLVEKVETVEDELKSLEPVNSDEESLIDLSL